MSRRRSSRIAAGTASGSSPTTSTSASCLRRQRAARRRFSTLADADERVVSTNSFSKSWLHDGLAAGLDRRAAGADARSRQADRVQHVVLAGVRPARGRRRRSPTAKPTVARNARAARGARATCWSTALARLPGIEVAPPPGAMYVFFRVAGAHGQPRVLQALVREARLGLAPGSAFGPEGEGFVRWCFAADDRAASPTASRASRASRAARAVMRAIAPRCTAALLARRRAPAQRAADMTKTLRVAFPIAENGFDPQAIDDDYSRRDLPRRSSIRSIATTTSRGRCG